MNIGEKIKRIRQHRRMTQKELGELVDLSANRIAQYEMGYRVPKKPLLNQIAEALRVSTVPLSDSYNGLKRYWGTASLIGRVAVPATKLIPAEYDTAQYETNQNRTIQTKDQLGLLVYIVVRGLSHHIEFIMFSRLW